VIFWSPVALSGRVVDGPGRYVRGRSYFSLTVLLSFDVLPACVTLIDSL
jgi:hypothetical protein